MADIQSGWYPDPTDDGDLRWWDGLAWTGDLHVISTADPEPAAPPGCWTYESDPCGTGVETPVVLHATPASLGGADVLDLVLPDGGYVASVRLVDGAVQIALPSLEEDVRRAAGQWCLANGRQPPAGLVRSRPTSLPNPPPARVSSTRYSPAGARPPAPSQVLDLASRRPGQGLDEIDERLRASAPKRSFLARLFRPTPTTSWGIGHQGEAAVGRILQSLGSSWFALHSVPVGRHGADIDHVVIGPPGVFTINTKHHPRTHVSVSHRRVSVGGVTTDYLESSRVESQRAERLLSRACGARVSVLPLIVVWSRGYSVESHPIDVDVIRGSDLASWLLRQEPRISSTEVTAIYERARWSNTWTA